MPFLQQKTIENIAKKHEWQIDKRNANLPNKSYTFIWPPHLNGGYTGAISLQKPLLKWKDARIKNRPHVHLNVYFPWPLTKKECLEILTQIEKLIKEYC